MPTDHLVVTCSPSNRPENLRKSVIFCDRLDRNRQSFNLALDNQDFDYILEYTNVDNALDELNRVLMVELNHYCPLKKVKMSTRDPFYITPLRKFLTKQKNRAYSLKKYQKAAELEAKIKKLIRHNLRNTNRTGSKHWWRVVNQTTGQTKSDSATSDFTPDDINYVEPEIIESHNGAYPALTRNLSQSEKTQKNCSGV